MSIIKNGVIADKIDERDFLVSNNIDKEFPLAKHTYKDTKIEYNQKEVHENSCTLHSALGAFSDLTGYKFSISERKKLWEEAKKRGASEDWGWYLVDAVNLVREYVNTLNIGKFITARVGIATSEFYQVLKRGYSVATSYNGNEAYNTDLLDDGIIQDGKVGDRAYGHAMRVYDITPDTKSNICAVDNYTGSKTWKNHYIIDNIERLYSNGTWNVNGYVFLYDEPDIDKYIDYQFAKRFANKVVVNAEPGTDGAGKLFMIDRDGYAIDIDSLHLIDIIKPDGTLIDKHHIFDFNGKPIGDDILSAVVFSIKKKILDNVIPLGMTYNNFRKFPKKY